MTLKQFLKNYYFQFTEHKQSNGTHTISVHVIKRADSEIIGSVKTTFDVQKMTTWIADSRTPIAINSWDWETIIDQAIRAHLSQFAQQVPIEDFYPMNPDTSLLNLWK